MKLKTLLTDNVIKLIKNRSLVRFIIEFKKQSKNSIVLYFIENADDFESFIKNGFAWHKTKQGYYHWKKLSKK